LILTAAHVVGDCLGSEVEARWWHSENDDDRKLVQCQEIAWDGRKQQIAPFDQSTPCDVVLLRCPFPESLAGQWGTVASIRPQDHVPFASSGFAFDGDRGKTPIDFSGETNGLGDRSPFFALDVKAWREKPDDWKGASGAPVIVGSSIVGVIVNTPQKFNASRLNAVPIFRLLTEDQPEFCSLVNYSPAEDHQRQLTSAAAAQLRKSADAVRALAAVLGIENIADTEENANRLTKALMQEDRDLGRPVEIAAEIVKAQRNLDSGDQKGKRGHYTYSEK
jgi:hypothetical protein